ncbi:MAG TPA: hypothetical protein PLH88_09945 [Spirochaetota bacterium]|nr:hypothetical protein [Spirochaetota bacterium]
MKKEINYSIAIIFFLVISIIMLPKLFPLIDEKIFIQNYRIPYYAGEDYFLFKKYAKFLSQIDSIPLLGDSVIWGHYVHEEESLSGELNLLSQKNFRNAGIDGVHPAAMNGLVEYFAGDIKNKKVIIGINLLWMSSRRHDLSGEQNNEINHKILLPQFLEKIPAYQPTIEERLSSAIKKNFEFLLWADHIKISKFNSSNLYQWTMENPQKNIIDFFKPEEKTFMPPESITLRALTKQDIQWVDMEASLQWRFILKTIKILQDRNNKLLAIITPFNEHMMSASSIKKMDSITKAIKEELKREDIEVIDCPMLLPEEFADSSHPTAKGYEKIAKYLIANKSFLKFIER